MLEYEAHRDRSVIASAINYNPAGAYCASRNRGLLRSLLFVVSTCLIDQRLYLLALT